jgi:predicted aldo/keto reductase-like oxidoreductase
MQYREFGKLGFKVSTFGFGCMRLPVLDGDSSRIDEKEAIAMIRHAIDSGVNYIDTAYRYHQGNSELVVAKALRGGYRDRVRLATKLPSWLVKTTEDFDRFLDEQLKKLETDHIDFYLIHGLDAERWPQMKALGLFDFIDRAKKSGRIKHIGFSFHDELPAFKEIIDGYDGWEMCQIQLNLIDERYQAGVEGMRYAAEKGIPVVVMEPLKGGSLTQNVPEDVLKVWNEGCAKRSPAEWAFRWVCNFPQVTVVLSGVSTMEQLDDNLKIFENVLPGIMDDREMEVVGRVQDIYTSRIKVGCTGCSYCMPCPSGVAIPDIFKIYNEAHVFGRVEKSRKSYAELVASGSDASHCIECASCENACPQHIHVIEKLREAREFLEVQ